MKRIALTAAAIGAAVLLASVPADAQAPNSSAGWGPIAAQAANAVTSGVVVSRPVYSGPGYAAYAYVPDPVTALASGLGAFASADQVVAASWYRPGLAAYAYAPGPLAVANYGLGMAAGAYCARRFKSYDASTGTYLGYDGQRHPCP